MNSRLSNYICNIKVFLMLFIVFLHTSNRLETEVYVNNLEISESFKTTVNSAIYSFDKHILQSCVPIFFIISGYLYFYNVDKFTRKEYFNKTKKRIVSAFIPYVIWNIFYGLSIDHLGALFYEDFKTATLALLKGIWVHNISSNGFTSPFNLPLWYLRDLLVVFLFTPLIYKLLKENNKISICFLISIGGIFIIFPAFSGYAPGFSTISLFFFCIGSYLGIRKIDLSQIFRGPLLHYLLVWMILVVLCQLFVATAIYDYLVKINVIIGSMVLLRALPSLFPKNKIYCNFLYQSNFFIYASHLCVSAVLGGYY